jgi:hypothetical protein
MGEAGNGALEDQGDRIYALRLSGISAREIAKRFNVTVRDVDEAVEQKMVRIGAKFRAAAIALDTERLERLLARFLQQAYRGDLASGHLCLKLLERCSHLLGLDSPLRLDAVVVTEAANPETSTAYYRRQLEELKAEHRSRHEPSEEEPPKPH